MNKRKSKEIKIEVAFGALFASMLIHNFADIEINQVIGFISKRELTSLDLEKSSLEDFVKSQKADWILGKPKSVEEILKSKEFNHLIIPKVVESLNSSANLLSLFIFINREISKIDWEQPQDVINFVYSIQKLLLDRRPQAKEERKTIREIKKVRREVFRANDVWKSIWHFVKEVPSVKRRWEREEREGKTYLRDWQRESQKAANKYYLSKKKAIRDLEKESKKIQDVFFRSFGFSGLDSFFNHFNTYLEDFKEIDIKNDAKNE